MRISLLIGVVEQKLYDARDSVGKDLRATAMMSDLSSFFDIASTYPQFLTCKMQPQSAAAEAHSVRPFLRRVDSEADKAHWKAASPRTPCAGGIRWQVCAQGLTLDKPVTFDETLAQSVKFCFYNRLFPCLVSGCLRVYVCNTEWCGGRRA